MSRYLFKRALQGVLTLFLLATIVFFFANLIIPGDFVDNFAMFLTNEQREALRAELGLDVPLWQQYIDWLGGLLHGDLGTSYFGVPVTAMLSERLARTLFIFVTGSLLAFMLGEWLGRLTAWRGPGPVSDGVMLVGILFFAFFPPALAYLVYNLLVTRLKLFPLQAGLVWQIRSPMDTGMPVMGFQFTTSPGASASLPIAKLLLALLGAAALLALAQAALRRFTRVRIPLWLMLPLIIGIWLAGWFAFGINPLEALRAHGTIITVYTLLTFGEIAVVMRTSMVDTLYEDYINTARAKGLRPAAVRNRHAARNALLPVMSKMIVSLPYLMTGLVIIELALGQEGLGRLLFESMGMQDYPPVMAILLIIGVLSLVARLALEVLIVVLDPRLRRASFNENRLQPRFPLLAALRDWLRRSPDQQAAIRAARQRERRRRETLVVRLKASRRAFRIRLMTIRREMARAWIIYRRNILGMIGLALVALFGLLAISHFFLVGSSVWPRTIYSPELGFDPRYAPHPSPPSRDHLLGTDVLGRDVLSMLMHSAKSTFVLAITAALTTAVLSTLAGAAAAYFRGMVDGVLSAIADALLLLPVPITMTILGARYYAELNAFTFGLIYGLLAGLSSAAIVMRSHALTLMARPFVEAARVSGARAPYIIFRHLVPNMAPLAAVQMMIAVTGAVVSDGFISFFGLRSIRLNWGAMVYNAFTMLRINPDIPWMAIIAPTLALSLFAAAFYLIARGLHDVADPRLQER
jgi:ABC-type dipeptide/oligopeptide/nickel transport system permease component